VLITSTTNPRVKGLVRLRNRRERDASGRFLIEGYRELARALQGRIQLEELYYCPSLYLGENEPTLVEAAGPATELVELGEEAFRRSSHRDRPEGLLGVARQFATGFERLDLGEAPLVLVVESIEKPGNLGAMLRTAEAAGANGIVVCDPATDPFNPNVVRASLGTLFLVPLVVSGSPEALAWLRARDVAIVAATPGADLLHWQADYRSPVAVVIGSEQYGLSDLWLEAATHQVRIPMAGSADSLNAATAAGVLLFEAVRQRALSGGLGGHGGPERAAVGDQRQPPDPPRGKG
jgi:TrmH family RNA methyltransferase